MNSNSTTFPLKDDNETFCPFNPLAVTTGKVKSGAVPEGIVLVGVVVVEV
jgi:hypothetical protein